MVSMLRYVADHDLSVSYHWNEPGHASLHVPISHHYVLINTSQVLAKRGCCAVVIGQRWQGYFGSHRLVMINAECGKTIESGNQGAINFVKQSQVNMRENFLLTSRRLPDGDDRPTTGVLFCPLEIPIGGM